jgi:YVTN family beta-propeller protein
MRSFYRPGAWVFLVVVLFALPLLQLFARPPATRSETRTSSSRHSSSAIAVTSDGLLVLAVNPDSNSISLIDPAGPALLAEIAVGRSPQSLAVAGDDGLAYVSNKDSDSLSVVDLAGRQVVAEIALGDRPQGVAVSPDGRFLAVAELGDDRVRFLATDTLQTAGLVGVADRPYGLAFTPDGRYLLVSHLLSGAVTVLAVRPYARYLPLVAYGAAGGSAPAGIAADSPPAVIPTWPHVAPAPAVVVSGDGRRAYLPQTMANGLGLNTQFDNTVFPKVSVLNLETWSHQTGEHISLPETDQPVGLPWDAALARDGTELWVVNAASNNLSVIDITNPTLPLRQAHIEVGANPRGVAISPDGLHAYVNNTLDGTVTVIDSQAYTVTAVIPVTDIPLPPLLLAGKRLYFSSARPELAQAAWISCNTCHIEGEHDGRTWLLQFIDWEPGIGRAPLGFTPVITRNTTSLLGMIETYPLRWSAEWDESADSEFSIRFEQFGAGLIEGEMHPPLGLPNQGRSLELDQLAAFIDSLALPQRSHSLTAAEERGRLIFNSPGTECLVCHPPPLYTDLQQHDVGTADAPGELFGPDIDTPSLRFLYDSAPYLHDGSAASLLEVLTSKNPADEHGRTSHLSPAELADLVAFMLALPYDPGP